ncbi:MAG TPA: hypothetical protein VFW40_13760, partial [Capsulimonadaceae bacterium]|nr:hypothetical protein [Capsulimonadaceae bacterium]
MISRPARLAFALLPALALLFLLSAPTIAQDQLVNGKKITLPPLGTQFGVGSLPVNMIATPDGRYAIVSNMGDRESLWSLSTVDGKGVSHIEFAKGDGPDTTGLYYGLAVGQNGNVYVSQGTEHKIAVIKLSADGQLTQAGAINAGADDFTAGMAVDWRGNLLVVNKEYYNSANPWDIKEAMTRSSLAIYSTSSGKQIGRVVLPAIVIESAIGKFSPPQFAFAIAALANGARAFVTSQRDGVVYAVDTSNPGHPKIAGTITVGSHPDALALNRDQNRLYVANAQSDTVSVLDTRSLKVIDTILLRPDALRGLPGATPTDLALSRDQKTLYVTLGDMNAVAVVGLAGDRLRGYIPTGWYPSALVATRHGKLLVANAYGTKTRTPNGKPVNDWTYVLDIIEGDVSSFTAPTPAVLRAETRQVLANNRATETHVSSRRELALMGLPARAIKHVIYIIKENRTYDQVLGDVAAGNGDPSLTLFGKEVTPNQHALAERFVLLDNFYCCGEVSGIGWPWSTQGIANEYVVKNVPYDYSGRSQDYEFEGQVSGYPVGGFPAMSPYGVPLSKAFPHGAPAIPDVTEASDGHIWDIARRAGLTYRNYGFFYTFGSVGIIPDNYPDLAGNQPAGHDLGGMSDVDFRRFDNDYPDSDAPGIYYKQDKNASCLYAEMAYGHYQEPSRFAEWDREFKEMLAKAPDGRAVPKFMTIRLPHDHNQGGQSGKHTPRSEVADNDYGVGQIVDAVSHSPIWRSTAIFVIEDDAQDGQDHVDCHRSTCYVISPRIKKNSV